MSEPGDPTEPSGATEGGRVHKRRCWARPYLLKLALRLGPVLISGLLWLISWTLRVQMVHMDDLFARWASGERAIVALWHNRVVTMPIAARGQKVCILVSHSRDGEIATRALARWGIRTVRGSASRGGAPGFLQLVRTFRQGYSLAVVPDGPRGPRYEAKIGVIQLAKATGAPIFPVSCAASRAIHLRSWDRLIVPLPFSRVVFVGGEPLAVARDCTDAEAEEHRRLLEERLNDLTRDAEARVAA